jgi:hypothetical protein
MCFDLNFSQSFQGQHQVYCFRVKYFSQIRRVFPEFTILHLDRRGQAFAHLQYIPKAWTSFQELCHQISLKSHSNVIHSQLLVLLTQQCLTLIKK